MPIFGDKIDEKEVEDNKKKIKEFQKKYGVSEAEANKRPEQGIEELDLEEIVPGGSYLSMVTPTGLGKKALQRGMRHLGKEAFEMGEKKLAKEGPRILEKMAEKVPAKLDYAAMKAERSAAREASEAAAPVMDYSKEAMKKTKEELAREAKRKKIKPTSFEYGSGNSPIETK